MQSTQHQTIRVNAASCYFSAYDSEISVSERLAGGDKLTVAGLTQQDLWEAVTSYVRQHRHRDADPKTAAWLESLLQAAGDALESHKQKEAAA